MELSDLKPSEFPDDPKERALLADQIADKVRELRVERERVPWGPKRRRHRKAIGLKIYVLRWFMHLLNPQKYKPVKLN